MHAHLKSGAQRLLGHGLHVCLGRDDQAGVVRIVGVRREQGGAARSQRAVGEHFDGANPQVPVVGVLDDSGLQVLVDQSRVVPEHRIVADRVLAGFDQLDVRGEARVVGARLGDGRQPPTIAFDDGGACGPNELLMRRMGHFVVDQILRVVDEDAGWISLRVAHDAAAGGIGRRLGDAGKLHGFRIGENRVAVEARKRNRPVRDRSAERLVRRERFSGPQVLIPAVAENPRIRRGPSESGGLRNDVRVRM